MDTGRGMFCRGPPGPPLGIEYSTNLLNIRSHEPIDLPLTANLVQEDVLLRFLATLRLKDIDRDVIAGIRFASTRWGMPVKRFPLQPTIFSMSTNTPIFIANNVWETNRWETISWGLEEGAFSGCCPLDNGLTR